jgi:hypothetical protein
MTCFSWNLTAFFYLLISFQKFIWVYLNVTNIKIIDNKKKNTKKT